MIVRTFALFETFSPRRICMYVVLSNYISGSLIRTFITRSRMPELETSIRSQKRALLPSLRLDAIGRMERMVPPKREDHHRAKNNPDESRSRALVQRARREKGS